MPRTTLVLLPGLLNTRRVFEQQIEALSDVADCIVPELWHHASVVLGRVFTPAHIDGTSFGCSC